MFFRTVLFVCSAVLLAAQTPPPSPAPPTGVQATPIPKTMTLPTPKPPVAAPAAPSVPPDKVILKIGDVSVTAAQFDLLIDMLPEQSRAAARGPSRKQFADNLVRVMVLADEGKRRGLDQTPAFKLQTNFQQNNYLAGLAFGQISKEEKISDEEAHKYYDEHKQEWDSVQAKHILIRFQGSPVPVRQGEKDLTEAEALAKAEDLRKKIAGGADFAALAKAESDDTGSGANGGDLGTFSHGQMVAAFDTAAFAMKPGDLSEPVKTQFGYHIIKVEKHEAKSFEEARADIDHRLLPQQSQKTLDDLVKKAAPVYDSEYFNTASH
jgi:peptidyl-prolyl cis-trans isomerase C